MLAVLVLLANLAWGGPSVAVADLVNHTGQARFEPAGPGTASMLMTKLAAVDSITVVERTQLAAVLSEIELSKVGAVDDKSRIEAGRIIGADFIVLGTLFSVESGVLTVNVRVVDTETAKVVKAADVLGSVDDDGAGYFDLVNRLTDEVIDGLAIELTDEQRIAVTRIRLREVEALLKYGTLAKDDDKPAARSAQSLWRDRSRDMMGEYQRMSYAVFTDGGARVPNALGFAELVGDQARVERFTNTGTTKDDRRDRREGRRAIGWVYSPEEADRWIEDYNRRLAEADPG